MMPVMNMRTFGLYYAERASVPAVGGSADVKDALQPENEGTSGVLRRNFDSYECKTCKNRKYQDGSNDPGVSFKTPTKLSPESAVTAVRSHENEHVSHAKAQALREDRKIVSQSVSYSTAICPECGRSYVSGGTTRTVFKDNTEEQSEIPEKGKYIDLLV